MQRNRLPVLPVAFGLALLHAAAAGRAHELGTMVVSSGDFRGPVGVCANEGIGVDARAYVADTLHQRIQHAAVDELGPEVAWEEFGFVADPGLPQSLRLPQGIAISGTSVYVADTWSHEVQRFEIVSGEYVYDPSFVSTTRNAVAGSPIRLITDVAVDASGNVYAYDSGNQRILRAAATDAAWTVWRQESSFGDGVGLDVSADGALVYLASESLHQVLVIPRSGPITAMGAFGTAEGELRSPQDVLLLPPPDGRLLVADKGNHRVVVLNTDGTFSSLLVGPPHVDSPERIARSSAGEGIFVVDSSRSQLIAFLPGTVEAGLDVYIRDTETDDGSVPSDAAFDRVSPDIVIRHAADIDVTTISSLSGIESQAPRFGESNYIYVGIRNAAPADARAIQARLYWRDGTILSPRFPEDWSTEGFYESFVDEGHASLNREGHTLEALLVPAAAADIHGEVVVGPITWRPPAPETTLAGDGLVNLRALLVGDGEAPRTTGLPREENNVAEREVTVLDGPLGFGTQNLLAIRVRFQDDHHPVDLGRLGTSLDHLEDWVEEVSNGAIDLRHLRVGPFMLSGDVSAYTASDVNPLVELASEALNLAYEAAPEVLDGFTTDVADDVTRVMIIVGDPAFDRDWSTTGPFPYEIGDETRWLSVSIHSEQSALGAYAHGFANQLGMADLYPYDNVLGVGPNPPQPPTRWDVLAEPRTPVHPLAWTKEQARWLTSADVRVEYLPHRNDTTTLGPIDLAFHSKAGVGDVGAIVVGRNYTAGSMEDEDTVFVVEARSPMLRDYDAEVPGEGVLIYSAAKGIPQGQMPVWMSDHDSSTPDVADPFPAGTTVALHGPGADTGNVEVTVHERLPDQAGYRVSVRYEPYDRSDIYIEQGDAPWESPDIWADNPRDGPDPDGDGIHFSDPPEPGDELPIPGMENRLCARVHNRGRNEIARDVEIAFMISFPHHAVGGVDQFDDYRIVRLPELPEGATDVCVPAPDIALGTTHGCTRVEIRRVPSDTYIGNNAAQQNFNHLTSEHASPYDAVSATVQFRNSEPEPRLVYFVLEGLPEEWEGITSPAKALVAPGDTVESDIWLRPHFDQPDCTDRTIRVTGWTPQADTLLRLGGTTLDVGLRQRTELYGEPQVRDCADPTWHPPPSLVDTGGGGGVGACADVAFYGCTAPPRPSQLVTVTFMDADGIPTFVTVPTDGAGCFEAAVRTDDGGDWEITPYYAGNQCLGPASERYAAPVALPHQTDEDADGVADRDESWGDTDHDGTPNHRDADSDNDGLLDAVEGFGDADLDGRADAYDWNGRRYATYGFAWANQPTASSYTPPPGYRYSTAGSGVSISRAATGVYDVRFAGLGGSGGNVQVSAYGSGSGHCQVGGWGGSADLSVRVRCYSASGAPQDGMYTVQFYSERRTGDLNDAGRSAYLWAHAATTARYDATSYYAYNDTGAANEIVRLGTGRYEARLPGMAGGGGNPQVTAYGSTPARCNVAYWYPSEGDARVHVRCHDVAGAYLDSRFTLAFTQARVAALSDDGRPSRGAYLWAGHPSEYAYTPSSWYQWNGFVAPDSSATSNTITRTGLGQYNVWIPRNGTAVAHDSVAVTAYGSSGECRPAWWSRGSTGTTVRVQCRNAAGALADSAFNLSYLTDAAP